jgi:hypothetical protein
MTHGARPGIADNACRRSSMNEHDDDLESTVHEQAEEETDTFPDTGDELNDVTDDIDNDDQDPPLDDDEAEL